MHVYMKESTVSCQEINNWNARMDGKRPDGVTLVQWSGSKLLA